MRDSLRARATVEAYDKGYRVNDKGEVISPTEYKRKPQPYTRKGKKAGTYYRFTISMSCGRKTTVNYHQLAGYQKFGKAALAEGTVVRHLDGNSENNKLSNFALGDNVDNYMDQPEETIIARAKHAASFKRKLTMDQARQLREDRKIGMTYRELGERYGIPKSSISYIINNKTYPEPT